MKYKILLAGKANSIIDDFFLRMSDSFEVMTTSLWPDDIMRHVKYFQPHLFLYCTYNESREDYNKMVSLKYQLVKSRVHFGVLGSQTDITEFERSAVNVADLLLIKPLTLEAIQKKIRDFLLIRVPLDTLASNTDIPSPAPEKAPASNTVTPASLQSAASLAAEIASLSLPQRRHILVVDDDPRMLKMLKEQLHHDYDVATAVNGKIAMKFLEGKHTDLILLDYEMPEEKGPVVLEKIRANESTKDVPVIFLTGVTEKEKIQKALVLQPQGYLLKPIDRERLMETITKVLEG